MGFPELYAQEVFRELNKRPYKHMHTIFLKEYKKLCEKENKKFDSKQADKSSILTGGHICARKENLIT